LKIFEKKFGNTQKIATNVLVLKTFLSIFFILYVNTHGKLRGHVLDRNLMVKLEEKGNKNRPSLRLILGLY
jgi:hypothetical protein